MSSNVSKTTPLYLELKPSRLLAMLLSLGYIGGILLLWLLPLLIPLKLLATLWLLYDWRRQWRRRVSLVDPAAIVAVYWLGEGEWQLDRRGKRPLQWLGLVQSVNHPWLTVLNFSGGDHVVLLPDSAEAVLLRRLRVRLTLGDGSYSVSE